MGEICDRDFEAWPLVAVVGPTGSGKSALALRLAEALGGEIVHCDSVQVYRGLDVGSAKTPVAERGAVPHHLIDVAGPEEDVTAGAYARMARRELAEVRGRRRIPVVAGGTGFYLRALLEGLSPAPGRDERVRERLERAAARRQGVLHRYLRRYDARAAERIHANDVQKSIRAVELTMAARRPAGEVQQEPREGLQGFAVLKMGLAPERAALNERLDRRAREMFERGLVEETKALLDDGVDAGAKALQSLGYRQAVQLLAGQLTKEDAIRETQLRTRQYAKRQMTWFRAERGVEWLAGFGWNPAVQGEALRLAGEFVVRRG